MTTAAQRQLYQPELGPSNWTMFARDFHDLIVEQQDELRRRNARIAGQNAELADLKLQLAKVTAELHALRAQADRDHADAILFRDRESARARKLRNKPKPPEPTKDAAIHLEHDTRSLWVHGVPVRLSKREHQMVSILYENRGREVTAEHIQLTLYGGPSKGDHHKAHDAGVLKIRLYRKLGALGIDPQTVCKQVGNSWRSILLMPAEEDE